MYCQIVSHFRTIPINAVPFPCIPIPTNSFFSNSQWYRILHKILRNYLNQNALEINSSSRKTWAQKPDLVVKLILNLHQAMKSSFFAHLRWKSGSNENLLNHSRPTLRHLNFHGNYTLYHGNVIYFHGNPIPTGNPFPCTSLIWVSLGRLVQPGSCLELPMAVRRLAAAWRCLDVTWRRISSRRKLVWLRYSPVHSLPVVESDLWHHGPTLWVGVNAPPGVLRVLRPAQPTPGGASVAPLLTLRQAHRTIDDVSWRLQVRGARRYASS